MAKVVDPRRKSISVCKSTFVVDNFSGLLLVLNLSNIHTPLTQALLQVPAPTTHATIVRRITIIFRQSQDLRTLSSNSWCSLCSSSTLPCSRILSLTFFRITISSSTERFLTTSTCTAAKTRSTSTPFPSIPSTTKRQTEPCENSSTKFQFFSLFVFLFFLFVSSNTNYCQLMQLDCVYIFTFEFANKEINTRLLLLFFN